MVKAGLGASVLPKWSIVNALASREIQAIRITKGGVFRTWYAVTLSNVAPTPFTDEFIRLLIKYGPGPKRPARRPALAS